MSGTKSSSAGRFSPDISVTPSSAPAALELLWRAIECDDLQRFSAEATSRLRDQLEVDYVAIVEPAYGQWVVLGSSGRTRALPEPLMAEALDRLSVERGGGWIAAPLRRHISTDRLLLVYRSPPGVLPSDDDFALLATVAGGALALIRGRHQRGRRIQRLEAILEIATAWYRTQEMEPLLVRIAEAATKLLDADRASIFLWDKPNHVLVSRPALGVEGDELRIPDDVGVVGQVIQSGQTRRIDRQQGQDQIDRHVDQQLGYHTETLLCVPLRGRDGKVLGAFETINKLNGDFDRDDEEALLDLASHAAIALQNTRERQQLLASRSQISIEAAQRVQLIGNSPAVEALRSTIRRVADTELAVLITGDNGTGKEVVAQLIHYLGRRRDQPLIAVNCAAIAESLLESELFGHEKGAFTDASQSRPGKFELAAGGTLFLDEIGDLSLAGQAKLLRVLEEKIVTRIGGSIPIHTDARVIAATNQNLAAMVQQKKFREDLFYRLNVVTLALPSLRDRNGDILLLADHFLDQFCRQARRSRLKLTPAAKRRLMSHPWPGNVRELRNLTERLAYLSPGETIDVDDLTLTLASGDGPSGIVPSDLSLSEATEQFQADYIKRVIAQAGGNMSHAAKRLGLHRSNLYRKMRGLGMPGQRN